MREGLIAELERAQQALRESQETHRAYLDNIHSAIFVADGAGRYLEVNRAACAMAGRTEEEMLAISVPDLAAPEKRGELQLFARLLETGSVSGEITIARPDGSRRIAAISAEKIAENRFVGFCVDVTDRRRAEESLRASEERYRCLVETAREGIWQIDNEHRTVFVNRRVSELIGYPAEEIVGRPLEEFFFEEDLFDHRERMAARRAGTSEVYERRFRRKDGSEIWTLVAATPIQEGGEVVGAFAMLTDITERKRATQALRLHGERLEQRVRERTAVLAATNDRLQQEMVERRRVEDALRESEAVFRSLAESASDGILVGLGKDGRHVFANQRAAELTGYSVSELLQTTIADLAPPDRLEQIEERFKKRSQGHFGPAHYETLIVKKGGAPVHVEIAPARILWHGEPGVLVTIRDITARKLAEDARLKEHDAQLQNARRLESLGLLAGGVAHDFNNLLTPVLARADLVLRKMTTDDPYRQSLEAIRKMAGRGRELTEQLLAFGRQQALETRAMSLGEVLKGYQSTLRRLVRANIALTIDVAAGGQDCIDGDPSRVGQVLLNLAMNGQDAMPDGGRLRFEVATVVLGAEQCSEAVDTRPGPYVVLTVTDTGAGMDEETLARVFDPFFSTKDRGKGTGLGLATVHGIVQQHGGFIDLESTPGEGTVFRLFFPMTTRTSERSGASAEDDEPSLGTETLLVVEDDADVREVTCAALRELGYRVLEADHGHDALSRFEQGGWAVDLLVTDVVMPKMGGPELYRRMGSHHPGLKVLYVSGYTDGIAGRAEIGAADADFLPKPFALGSLARKVRELLDRPDGHDGG